MIKKGKVIINPEETIGTINPNIYGYFIENAGEQIYPGIWVGEDSSILNVDGIRKDLLKALKEIKPSTIRWPGGCPADVYHWQDGIGPRDKRPKRVSCFRDESNQFGTDEFLHLCSIVGAEPYICVNVGSGSPEEARSWLEYCNYSGDSFYSQLRAKNGHPEPYRVKYWGIGNENWGCGGFFEPYEYSLEYRRFASLFPRPVSKDWGSQTELVACGHTTRDWNLKLMEALKNHLGFVDHVSIHHYFGGPNVGGDISFSDDEYFNLLNGVQEMEYHIKQAISIIDFFAEQRKNIGIAVDEWSAWYPQAKHENNYRQQNTLRDAILAASVLNLFHRYSEKVSMANISEMVNILQALFLTKEEKLLTTPTYYIYDMYKYHIGNTLKVETFSPILKEAPPLLKSNGSWGLPPRKSQSLTALDVSASVDKNGKELVITLINKSLDEEVETEIILKGDKEMIHGRKILLIAPNVRSFNNFDFPENVKLVEDTLKAKGRALSFITLPHSVNILIIELG